MDWKFILGGLAAMFFAAELGRQNIGQSAPTNQLPLYASVPSPVRDTGSRILPDGKFNVIPRAPWVSARPQDRDVVQMLAMFRERSSINLLSVHRCTVARCGVDARYLVMRKPTDHGVYTISRSDFIEIREILDNAPGPHGYSSDQSVTAIPEKSFVWFFAVDTPVRSDGQARQVLDNTMAPMMQFFRERNMTAYDG